MIENAGTTSFTDPLMGLRVAVLKDGAFWHNLLPSEEIVGAGCHYFPSTRERAKNHRFLQIDEETGDGLVPLDWVAIDCGELVIDLTLPEVIDSEVYAEFWRQMSAAIDSADPRSALREFAQDNCRFCPGYTLEEPELDFEPHAQGGVDAA